jgi:acetylornithine/succinyldiaminopimelate/putrescine aminotransferase
MCCRIRFAPPLVIEEADLRRAIDIIAKALKDFDEVSHLLLRPKAY